MAHVLVVPYPSQGHMNPMVQFAKNLASKGVAATLVTTHFIARTACIEADPLQVEAISDGHDEGGYRSAASLEEYLARLEVAGSASLAALVVTLARSGRPVTCVVYDTLTRSAARTARGLGLPAVSFFTQSCAVSAVYRCVDQGELAVPPASDVGRRSRGCRRWSGGSSRRSRFVTGRTRRSLPSRLPSSLTKGRMTGFCSTRLKSWRASNQHDYSFLFGPCVPLTTAESGAADSFTYNADVLDPEYWCIKWLDTKPPMSVAYVSFGSFMSLDAAQTEEVARGLLAASKPFLWVVRETDEAQLPRHLLDEATASGDALVVRWSPQLDVLAHRAVGCFVTHCGWNSTLEALCFGVPMVAVPLWTDQPTNARFVEQEWGAGVRARRLLRGEIERCVRAVMDGDGTAASARDAARRWSDAARAAVSPGRSSDRNLEEFVAFVRAGANKKGKASALEHSETAGSEL